MEITILDTYVTARALVATLLALAPLGTRADAAPRVRPKARASKVVTGKPAGGKPFKPAQVKVLRPKVKAAAVPGTGADNAGVVQAGAWPNPTRIDAVTRNSSLSDVPIVLAENGLARFPIIISPDASDELKKNAAELAAYLEKISGAHFTVQTGDGKSGIVLGTLDQFPNAALDNALKIYNSFDGKEAYVIRTRDTKVLLLGATDRGAAYAAVRMLELLGCRWFFQGPKWTVVPPAQQTLSFNFNETDRPQIWGRWINYAWGIQFFDDNDPDAVAAYKDWNRHNRMGLSLQANTGHAWDSIILQNKAEFEKHPEYYALVQEADGSLKRRGPQLEVTNPAVQQIAIKYALDYLKALPNTDMVSMDPADGMDYSVSEASKELGRPSDQAFYLANIVAKAVAAKYPGKMVGILAYNWHCEPPPFPLEPNVHVQITAGFTTGKYSYDELLKLWPLATTNIGYYDYFSTWLWDRDLIPGGRVAGTKSYLQPAVQNFAAHAARSLMAESGDNWGVNGLGYYISSKLMWNPDADVAALEDDFYKKAFGPAAPAMRKYYEHLSPDSKPLYGKSVVGRAYRDLAEAAKVAEGDAEVTGRLDDLKLYLQHNYLYQLIQDAPTKDEKKLRTLDWIKHNYRIRNTYMTHWSALVNGGINDAITAFGDQSWFSLNNAHPAPWRVHPEPYSKAETDAMFAEGLAYYPAMPDIAEKQFSKDLVPLRPGKVQSPEISMNTQGPATWAMYSAKGEPLEVRIYHGFVYQTELPGVYTLTDARGNVVSTGPVPSSHPPKELKDGWVVRESNTLKLKVPKPGTYHFEFYDAGSGWQCGVAPNNRVVLNLQRGHGYSGMGVGTAFVYVPKGTKTVDFFANTGGEVVFYKPDDLSVIGRFPSDGSYGSLPVPDGMDGQLWRVGNLDGFLLGQLYFFNIPNYLGYSPSAMLVPREVALADGIDVKDK